MYLKLLLLFDFVLKLTGFKFHSLYFFVKTIFNLFVCRKMFHFFDKKAQREVEMTSPANVSSLYLFLFKRARYLPIVSSTFVKKGPVS